MSNTAVITIGKFDPVHKGHQEVLKTMRHYDGDKYLFVTATSKSLAIEEKIDWIKRSFKDYTICENGGIDIRRTKDIISMMEEVNQINYDNVIIVLGSDRIEEIKGRIYKYNKDLYNFDNIEIVSAGQRDNSKEISGLSSTKMREWASNGLIYEFYRGLPDNLDWMDRVAIYNAVRSHLDVNEAA